jgi:hypothetical protein
MCAGAQTASVAHIKAERSRKLARRTSRRLIQQRDGEHGPKAGEVEHQSLRSRVRASRQAHGEHRALAWLAETGTCPDPRTFYLDRIEEAVVAALRAELRHPDVIAEFVRTYHEERRRLASQQGAKRTAAERRLAEPVEKSSALLAACLGASLPQRSSVPARPRWTRSANVLRPAWRKSTRVW